MPSIESLVYLPFFLLRVLSLKKQMAVSEVTAKSCAAVWMVREEVTGKSLKPS